MDPARVLVLGIDAASPALLSRWMDDGTLANLGALRARGLSGATRSVEGFFIGSTWPSFSTGVTPAGHGIHYTIQLRPGTYRFERTRPGDAGRCAPFWSHLSRAGRRVAILDVPLSRIEPSLHGIQVVEWGSHDAVYGFQAWPGDVEASIRSGFGAHPLRSSCDAMRRSPEDYTAFIETLVNGVQAKARLTRHFLRQGGWDFFLQVFTEAHCAGHQCWHLHDAHHPAHDGAVARAVGDPLRRVYAAIDAAIGEIVELAGDAVVVVVAPHGMAHWYGAQFLLPEILFRLGVARPPASPHPRGAGALARAGARRAWRLLPPLVRRRWQPLGARLRRARAGGLPGLGVDPAESACFAVPNGLAVGGIRLNLIGREPRGVLDRRAADAFGDELAGALLDITDERTGRPLVRRVLRTAALYPGQHLGALPDLLVEWSDEVPTGSTLLAQGAGAVLRARSARIGLVEGANDYGRTGEHRPEGMFIAAGPRVRPGRLDQVTSILDFAPTFAGLLGVALPRADGRPMAALRGDLDGERG